MPISLASSTEVVFVQQSAGLVGHPIFSVYNFHCEWFLACAAKALCHGSEPIDSLPSDPVNLFFPGGSPH
eukprot:323763-Amphidinium_carterae.2